MGRRAVLTPEERIRRQREYAKAYYHAHREKRNEYAKAYYDAHREERREYNRIAMKKYREKHPEYVERTIEYMRQYNERKRPEREAEKLRIKVDRAIELLSANGYRVEKMTE